MIIGTALGWSDLHTIALAVVLAFFFGYLLTSLPLLRSGMAAARGDPDRAGLRHDLDHDHGDRRQRDHAADPGAMEASLTEIGFWAALAGALLIAGAAAYPANRWLLARGKGHAVRARAPRAMTAAACQGKGRGTPPRALARRIGGRRQPQAGDRARADRRLHVRRGGGRHRRRLAGAAVRRRAHAHRRRRAGALAGGDPARPPPGGRGDDLRAQAHRDPRRRDQRVDAARARPADRLRGHPAADRPAARRGRAGADRRHRSASS